MILVLPPILSILVHSMILVLPLILSILVQTKKSPIQMDRASYV